MEYTKEIKRIQNKILNQHHRLNLNMISWQPARKCQENLNTCMKLVTLFEELKLEIQKQ